MDVKKEKDMEEEKGKVGLPHDIWCRYSNLDHYKILSLLTMPRFGALWVMKIRFFKINIPSHLISEITFH